MQETVQFAEIGYADSQYPRLLREGVRTPPALLLVRGELPDGPMVAIVGSRRPTLYGQEITYKLAKELAGGGVTVVSGLALGIDAVAHQGAIDGGGKTVAVLGNGIDAIYPKRNESLGLDMLRGNGAVISEYLPGTPALKQHFPARNRIIAGMTLGCIVTEADEGSGSQITARWALEYGRVVMAVPGNITSLRSAGPNNLLRQGATPITSAVDVREALGLDTTIPLLERSQIGLSQRERLVMSLLQKGLRDEQLLVEASGLHAAEFAQTISLMEISGRVRNLGAGIWVPTN